MFVLVAHGALPPAATAGTSYFNIASIAGEDPTPGYPGAMATSTVTITPHTVTVVKQIDGASPDLAAAVIQGSQLGTTSLLLYNDLPAGPPDALLKFFNTTGVSYSTLNATTETVGFNADNPLELYLEVPGIPGEVSAPGHPAMMQIESFTFTAGDFRITKLVDSASVELQLASATGLTFPVARLLLYNSPLPQGAPAAMVEFHDVQVSAYQGNDQTEEVWFAFATITQPVPEPATLALVAAGAMLLVAARKKSARQMS